MREITLNDGSRMDGVIAARLYGRLQSAIRSHPNEMSLLYRVLVGNSEANVRDDKGNVTSSLLFNQIEHLEEDRVTRFMDLDRNGIITFDLGGVKDRREESELYDSYPITFSKNMERIMLNSLKSPDTPPKNLNKDIIPPSENMIYTRGNSPVSYQPPKLYGVVR